MLADTTHALARWWAPALAFIAGIVSFASPCVFPLVPGYLSFVTGEAVVDPGAERGSVLRARNMAPILLFIAGFTLVFTLYGAFSTTFVRIFKGHTGQVVAGLVVIAVGLPLDLGRLGVHPDRDRGDADDADVHALPERSGPAVPAGAVVPRAGSIHPAPCRCPPVPPLPAHPG